MIRLIALICMCLCFTQVSQAAAPDGMAELRATSKAFSAVARSASPAVVFIQTERVGQSGPAIDPFLERFFGRQFPQGERPKSVGQGSGFIVDSDGYILTNAHVVADSSRVTVALADGRTLDGTIVGLDKPTDVALVKIEARDLPVLEVADSDALDVGEWVIAMGNPFGLSHSLTVGVVSAKGRSTLGINEYENFIQTDAAINPGNSGGPLLNLDGKVVGINTAIFSRTGGSVGIGFAIPINMASRVQAQLRETGTVSRSYLGVAIQPLTPELAESFGVKDTTGVLVTQVEEGSPADAAGLQSGDVITALDGRTIATLADLRNTIALASPNSKVRLGLVRDGKRRDVDVVLANQDQSASGGTSMADAWGLSLADPTTDLRARYGLEDGQQGPVVVAVARGSAAERAGLQEGVVILEINRTPVTSAREAAQLLGQVKQNKVLVRIRHRNGASFVVLQR